jgi:hypothetical protein
MNTKLARITTKTGTHLITSFNNQKLVSIFMQEILSFELMDSKGNWVDNTFHMIDASQLKGFAYTVKLVNYFTPTQAG